jgi:hypothetical protein
MRHSPRSEAKNIAGIRSYVEMVSMIKIVVAGREVPENLTIAVGLEWPE